MIGVHINININSIKEEEQTFRRIHTARGDLYQDMQN